MKIKDKKIKVGSIVQYENNGVNVKITKIIEDRYYYNFDCYSSKKSLTLIK